jgi:hypothetical protein
VLLVNKLQRNFTVGEAKEGEKPGAKEVDFDLLDGIINHLSGEYLS